MDSYSQWRTGDSNKIDVGVKQGCILSPLLSIIVQPKTPHGTQWTTSARHEDLSWVNRILHNFSLVRKTHFSDGFNLFFYFCIHPVPCAFTFILQRIPLYFTCSFLTFEFNFTDYVLLVSSYYTLYNLFYSYCLCSTKNILYSFVNICIVALILHCIKIKYVVLCAR